MFRKSWIAKDDVRDWALGYLQRRSLREPEQPNAQELYDQLLRIDDIKGNTEDNHRILRNMKNAWNLHSYRSKQDERTPYNYELSAEAARALKRLSKDHGTTKTQTLETIILERLQQENAYKTTKKEEGAYKKRAAIFERQLDQALRELCEHQLLIEVGVGAQQHVVRREEVERRFRDRKIPIIAELPPLPSSNTRKPKRAKASESSAATTEKHSTQRTTKPLIDEREPKISSEITAEPTKPNEDHQSVDIKQTVPLGDSPGQPSEAREHIPSGTISSDSYSPEHYEAPACYQADTEPQLPNTTPAPAPKEQLGKDNLEEAGNAPGTQEDIKLLQAPTTPTLEPQKHKIKTGNSEITCEIRKKRPYPKSNTEH